MRKQILIIDDDRTKCADIKELFHHKAVNIDVSHTVYDGKDKLSKNYYDLLILDINLPYLEGEDCSEEAGYLLFKEINNVKMLRKPGHIVILTSYEELQRKYDFEVSKVLFTIVKYSTYEHDWKEKILNKLEYILTSFDDSSDLSIYGYKFDMAIITAVQIEFEQTLRIMDDVKTIKLRNDPTVYMEGYFLNGDKKKSVILAMQHQMGMTAAAVLTTKLINNFRPQYVSMVGIAAGKRGDMNYGDIIVPTEVWDYGSGKIASSDEAREGETADYLFQPDPRYLDLEVELKEIINKDYTDLQIITFGFGL